MSNYWNIGDNYRQMPAAQLRHMAEESVKAAAGKNKAMESITAHGKQICDSWWGQTWCRNLEQYADYASRIERGKRYVRTGAVIDLKIQNGKILARVQGSRKAPYKVEIRISPLSEDQCQDIIDKCGRKIQNMENLIAGNFPEDLKELFTGSHGLFPSPREVSFQCSCPDWALMCKHVAAVLYGIGVRLDDNPFLFFKLRGIDVDRFIDVTLSNKVEEMLKHADHSSSRIMDRESLDLFGVL